MNIFVYVTIVWYFSIVECNHFYGGTVTWKSLNNTDFNSTVSIMFTQSYQWRQSQTHCDQSYIVNQTLKIPMNAGKLQCITNSSTCGNYTSLHVNGYCTDFSTLIDSSSSQISNIEEIAMDSTFCVAYQGATWPGIMSSMCGSSCYIDTAKWSIGCCVDLKPRPDGFINTPPMATVISPIRVAANTVTNIIIPVTDADHDVLRCRWASNTSTFDECGDICGVLPGSTLDTGNCTLTFNSSGKQPGDFYAVALMVEDFFNATTSTALSNVSIQFLIQIVTKPACSLKPVINSNASLNTVVTIGIPYVFTVVIQSDCPNVSILDLFRSPFLNMHKSNITFNRIHNISLVTETWTPTSDQIGSQIYCAIATDSALIQSDFYCLTFNVISNSGNDNNPTGDASDSTARFSNIDDTTDWTLSTDSLPTTETSDYTTEYFGTSTTHRRSTRTTAVTPLTVTVIVTVTVPVPTESNSGLLGLGLGLGLPFGLALTALTFYALYRRQSMSSLSGNSTRRLLNRSQISMNQVESIETGTVNRNTSSNSLDDLHHYRQQPTNTKNKTPINDHSISMSDEPLSFSDCERSPLNRTKTSTPLFPPSTVDPLNDNAHRIQPISLDMNDSQPNGSILVRAYSVQRKDEFTD